MVNC